MIKKIFYSILILGVFTISLPSFVSAQDVCENYEVIIQGSSAFKLNQKNDFITELVDKRDNLIIPLDDKVPGAKVSYRLYSDGRVLERSDEKIFSFVFTTIADYELSVTVTSENCSFTDTLSIRSYSDVFFYFGEFVQDFNQGLAQNIQQHDILFSPFIMKSDVDDILDPVLLQNLVKKSTDIRDSSVLFFNVSNFSNVFSLIDWLEKEQGISFSQKNIVLVSAIEPSLLKKFLAPFVKEHELNLFVSNFDQLRDMFYLLSVGDIDGLYGTLQNPISFESSSLNYSLSRLVDVMIFNGFSMNFISMILVLSFAVLVLVFLRQVVGVSVFGFYYPLLFAIVFMVLGEIMTIVFFSIAFVAHLLGNLIQRYINLLVNAKIGLYLLLYILLTFLILGIVTTWFNLQWTFSALQDVVAVFGFLAIPILGKKVFFSGKKLLVFKQYLRMGLFILLAYLFSLMIGSVGLQHWLLVRPSLILLFLVGVIVVGRFTGLQVIEYVRFWPLIKSQIRSKKSTKMKIK